MTALQTMPIKTQTSFQKVTKWTDNSEIGLIANATTTSAMHGDHRCITSCADSRRIEASAKK